jgi:hypothetical protein
MEDLIKFSNGKFCSVCRGNRKLRCDHVIAIEAQHVTIGVLLEEGQEIVVDMGNDSSDRISVAIESGDDGVGVPGFELCSVSVVPLLNNAVS